MQLSVKKVLLILLPFLLFLACSHAQFVLEPPDFTNLIDPKSGLYVHREIELRVNAKRLESPPEDAAKGATSKLVSHSFFPLGVSSGPFIASKYEKIGNDLVWRATTHLSDNDFKGKTSLGANVSWEKIGSVTISDALEIFKFPPPKADQIDNWSPWVEAGSRRSGNFAWHAEANKHEPEKISAPHYPFQMRFKLVLSKRMYP